MLITCIDFEYTLRSLSLSLSFTRSLSHSFSTLFKLSTSRTPTKIFDSFFLFFVVFTLLFLFRSRSLVLFLSFAPALSLFLSLSSWSLFFDRTRESLQTD